MSSSQMCILSRDDLCAIKQAHIANELRLCCSDVDFHVEGSPEMEKYNLPSWIIHINFAVQFLSIMDHMMW